MIGLDEPGGVVMEKIPVFNRDLCLHCGACVGLCPTNALYLDDTYVTVDEEKCIGCGMCRLGCPMGAIRWKGEEDTQPPSPSSLPEKGVA